MPLSVGWEKNSDLSPVSLNSTELISFLCSLRSVDHGSNLELDLVQN